MARLLLGAFFLFAGLMHFLKPRPYVAIVPDALPRKREIVFASGVAEIAGGAGVLAARTRRGGGLVADRHADGRVPGQREHGGQRRAIPQRAGAAAVGAPAAAGRC